MGKREGDREVPALRFFSPYQKVSKRGWRTEGVGTRNEIWQVDPHVGDE